jgi:hypothetical protein
MELLLALLRDHWFTLVQTAGIIGSLLFTALSFRHDLGARRLENLIWIKDQHLRIWQQFDKDPALQRILELERKLKVEPVTQKEEIFVTSVILHLFLSYQAIENGLLNRLEGLEKDIRTFFAAPVPREVWGRVKRFQDMDFVDFVERALGDEAGSRDGSVSKNAINFS